MGGGYEADCPRPNMLARSTSPYLRMHACDPVEWVDWSYVEERLGKLGKPLFISIGYYSCKWCHVMQRESFRNPEVARWINRVFVPVKVDREERPDVDEYYMTYCMASRGSCGWPLTVLADEWGRPFYAATYMKPEALIRLARAVEEALRGGGLGDVAERAASALESIMNASPSGIPEAPLASLAEAAASAYDPAYGGFGVQPKFPQAPILLALLAAGERHRLGGAVDMVVSTLHHMVAGGIHDWVDGGFHRYTIDRDWRTPHFEKMLYDQGVLAMVIGEVLKRGRDPVLAEAGAGIVRLLRAHFLTPGGLASSLDAEAGGGEGLYYSVTPDEAKAALGDLYQEASEVFDFSPEGNYLNEETGEPSGRLLLHIGEPIPSLAERLEVSVEDVLRLIGRVAERLRPLRLEKGPPGRDWKVIASWNGLALWGLSSLAAAGIPGALELALEVYSRVKKSLVDGYRVFRVWSEGEARIEGMLPDYAHLALGFLAVHSVTGRDDALELAHGVAGEIPGRFQGPEGELRYRPGGPMEVYEGPTPSGYAAAVEVMWRLGRILDDRRLKDSALRAARAAAGYVESEPLRYPYMAVALDLVRGPVMDVVLSEGRGFEGALGALARAPFYATLAVNRRGGYLWRTAEYARSMPAVNGEATIYVCEEGVCSLPTANPGKALEYVARRGFRPSK